MANSWFSGLGRKVRNIIIIALILVVGGSLLWNVLTTRHVSFVVNAVDRDSNAHRWLVRTNNETFEIADQWTAMRFRGRLVAQKLQIGKAYEAKVQNIAIFGLYRNIMSVSPTDPLSVLPDEVKSYIDSLKHALQLKGDYLSQLQFLRNENDSLRKIIADTEAVVDNTY